SLSRATRSCGSLALLMRYSGSLPPGSCLTTSNASFGACRLVTGLIVTISPILNLWDIGSSPSGRITVSDQHNQVDAILTGAALLHSDPTGCAKRQPETCPSAHA